MQTDIQSQQFNFLLKKVKSLKNGERTIVISKKISLQFRYGTVRVHGVYYDEYLNFPVVNSKTQDEDVTQLVFDATGLHEKYITEIGVFKEEHSYILYNIPTRDTHTIQSFIKLLRE